MDTGTRYQPRIKIGDRMDGSGGDSIRQVIQYYGSIAWLIVLALWGGTASYLSRIKTKALPFSIVELIGEWCISGFAGVITMYGCQYLGLELPMTAAATGIAGHMGGRAIFLLERWFASNVKAKL